jgi:hypothetical protein
MARILLALLFTVFVVGSLSAQSPDRPAADYPDVHALPDEALDKYYDDPAFDYVKQKADVEEMSLWDLIKVWIGTMLAKAAVAAFSGGVTSYVVGIIVIGLLVILLSKLFGFDITLFYRGGKRASVGSHVIEEENIHEIDFAREIEEAMNNGQFRRVVRLVYLHMLKELSDREKINWKPYKTNADYLYEMKLDPLSVQFETLNYYFIYSWYGDFEVNLVQVEKVRAVFNEMKSALPKR